MLEPEFKRIKSNNRDGLTSSAVKMRATLSKDKDESTLYTTMNSFGKKPVTPSIAEYQSKLSRLPSKSRNHINIAFTRENRINKIFKLKTPGLKDEDIRRTLIENKSTQREHFANKFRSKQIRKDIFNLWRQCENNSKKSK